MAVGHEFRNFGSEEGFGGEGFTINSPFRAGAVLARRIFRSLDGRVGRDSVASGVTEGDDANGRHLGDLTRNVKVVYHLREVLVPTIEAIVFAIEFQDIVLRVVSGSFVSNLLGIEESGFIRAFSHKEVHGEFVSMANCHEFRNFGSDEGFGGEGFTINSPFRAGAVFVRRDNRSRQGCVGRNFLAVGFAESDDANIRHLGHVGVHVKSSGNPGEVLVPAIEAVAFDNRISRGFSSGTVSNLLRIMEFLEHVEVHVKFVDLAAGFKFDLLRNREFGTRGQNGFAIQPGVASEGVVRSRTIDDDSRVNRNGVALGRIHSDIADFGHFGQLGVDIQSSRNLGEVLAPTIETEAFDNRISRSHGGSIDSNELAVIKSTLDKELYREGLGNFVIQSRIGRIFGSSSERPVPTSELEGSRFCFKVSRDFRVVFFVVVEDHGTVFEGLLAQFLTEAGHEGNFEQFVQHGIVSHGTSVELVLNLLRSQHVAMIILPTLEGSTRNRRIGHGVFNDITTNGRCFINYFAINHERNLEVAIATREVKHRIIIGIIKPHIGRIVVKIAVLSIQGPDQSSTADHIASFHAFDKRNRRIGGVANSFLHLRQRLIIVVAVFNRRIFRMAVMEPTRSSIIFHFTNNATHGSAGNGIGRADRVQHHSRVVTRLIFIIIIEIVITNNTTGSATGNGAVVAAVIDGAIYVLTDNTTCISGARNSTQVLASRNTARNVSNVLFNISIMRTTHNTTSNLTGYRAIVDAGADSTRVRTGYTTNHVLAHDRGTVFAVEHRAIATITASNTTSATNRRRIIIRDNRNRCVRLNIFNNTIVQANNRTRILRRSSYRGIANRKVLNDTLLTDYTEKACIRIFILITTRESLIMSNRQAGNRLAVAIEDTFEGLAFGLTDRFEFRITTINVIHHDGIDDLAVFGPVTELSQVRALRKFREVFTKYGRISHRNSERIRCHGETETNCCCKYFFHNEPFLVGVLVWEM